MSNTITIELCAEDRQRLDAIIAGLTGLQCDFCTDRIKAKQSAEAPKAVEVFTPAESTTAATAAAEAPTPTNAPTEDEKPANDATEENRAPWEPAAPAVTLEQIQQKVVQLAAGYNGAKKAKVREIVNAYAKKVSDLPQDKWAEVWDKLTALERE